MDEAWFAGDGDMRDMLSLMLYPRKLPPDRLIPSISIQQKVRGAFASSSEQFGVEGRRICVAV